MELIVENEEAYQLASNLAQLTGKSIEHIVLDALRKEHVLHQQRAAKVNELMAIGAHCAAHLEAPGLAVDHGDMLYDEFGMPK